MRQQTDLSSRPRRGRTRNGCEPEGSLKAVIYLRVSSKEQEEGGFSIDAQRRLLEQYADDRLLSVLETFTDIETAKRAGRAQFGRMVDLLKATSGRKAILVEKTDRLYRNIKDWVLLDDLPDLEIHLVKEGTILTRDSRSSDKLIHGIKVLFAKNYIDNLSEESRKGMVEKARQGLWPSYAPIGYLNTFSPDGRKIIVPDPVLVPIVQSMFTRYAAGDCSLRTLRDLAAQAGLRTRGRTRTYGKAALQRILRNPIYKGVIRWDGHEYPGVHTPIVSPELWQTVQDELSGNRRLKGRRRKHDYPFARLVTCGHCGGLMTGQGHKGYVYYHCSGHHGKCPEPYVRQEKLEDAFCGVLRALAMDDEVLEWSRTNLEEHRAERALYREGERKRLQGQYEEVKRRFEAVYDDKLDGRLPDWLFQQKADQYQKAMAELLESLRLLDMDSPVDPARVADVFELARTASRRYSSLTEADKRKVLRSVVLNCSWKDGELSVLFRQPFDIIADAVTAWNEKKVAGLSDSDLFNIWYPRRDLNSS